MEQHEAQQQELANSQAVRAELEAKVARAASSLKAADDLKEARSGILLAQRCAYLTSLNLSITCRGGDCFGVAHAAVKP